MIVERDEIWQALDRLRIPKARVLPPPSQSPLPSGPDDSLPLAVYTLRGLLEPASRNPVRILTPEYAAPRATFRRQLLRQAVQQARENPHEIFSLSPAT